MKVKTITILHRGEHLGPVNVIDGTKCRHMKKSPNRLYIVVGREGKPSPISGWDDRFNEGCIYYDFGEIVVEEEKLEPLKFDPYSAQNIDARQDTAIAELVQRVNYLTERLQKKEQRGNEHTC